MSAYKLEMWSKGVLQGTSDWMTEAQPHLNLVATPGVQYRLVSGESGVSVDQLVLERSGDDLFVVVGDEAATLQVESYYAVDDVALSYLGPSGDLFEVVIAPEAMTAYDANLVLAAPDAAPALATVSTAFQPAWLGSVALLGGAGGGGSADVGVSAASASASLPTVNTLITSSVTPVLSGQAVVPDGYTLSVTIAGTTYTSENGLSFDAASHTWQLDLSGHALALGRYEVVVKAWSVGAELVDATHNELWVVADLNDLDNDGIVNDLDLDDDGDGVLDSVEGQGDDDGDGLVNAQDLDSDGDGIADNIEAQATQGFVAVKHVDADHDGLDDAYDQNVSDTSADASRGLTPIDTDWDGRADFVDTDADNDGVSDKLEAASSSPVDWEYAFRLIDSDLLDTDGDGLINYLDHDDDGDGIPDAQEISWVYVTAAGYPIFDVDHDGVLNRLDMDSDGDGIADYIEAQTTPGFVANAGGDSDEDGVDNAWDLAPTQVDQWTDPAWTLPDTDGDGVADVWDTDSDGDGIDDRDESGLTGQNLSQVYDHQDVRLATGVQDLLRTSSNAEPDFRFALPAAEIDAISKDTGDDSNNFVSSDGDAGGAIWGHLTAVLSANQSVVVSLDGGISWQDAVVNGTRWGFYNALGHTQDWQIQVKVVDSAWSAASAVTTQWVRVPASLAPQIEAAQDGAGVTMTSGLVGGVSSPAADGASSALWFFQTTSFTRSTGDGQVAQLSGVAQANSLVEIFDAGHQVKVGSVMADDAGHWRWAGQYGLDLGSHLVAVNTADDGEQTTSAIFDALVAKPGTWYASNFNSAAGGDAHLWTSYVGSEGTGTLSRVIWSGTDDGPRFGVLLGPDDYAGSGASTVNTVVLHDAAVSVTLGFFSTELAGQTATFKDASGQVLSVVSLPQLDNNSVGTLTYASSGAPIASVTINTGDDGGSFWVQDFTPESAATSAYVGSSSADVFSLDGVGVFEGGDGDDTFVLSASGLSHFQRDELRIEGGSGADRVVLPDASSVLDLTRLTHHTNYSQSQISSVSAFDLGEGLSNTMVLSLNNVLSLGERDAFFVNGRTQILVDGDDTSVVQLLGLQGPMVDLGHWQLNSEVFERAGVQYEVFSHSDFEADVLVRKGVLVADDVQVVITDNVPGVANLATGDVVFTFKFSEDVIGFDAGDVQLSHGSKGDWLVVDGSTYQLTVTPEAAFEGDMVVGVAKGAAKNAQGFSNMAATPDVQPVDTQPPVFTSPDVVHVNENTATSVVVYQAQATDVSGIASYVLSGVDANRFTIDAQTGQLQFVSSPDYERPADVDGNNSYQLVVTTQDGVGNPSSHAVTVIVDDVDERNLGNLVDADAAANWVYRDANVGSVVGLTARALDPDSFDVVSYRFLDDSEGRFAINASSGLVTVVKALGVADVGLQTVRVEATSTDGSVRVEDFAIDVVKPTYTTGEILTNANIDYEGGGWGYADHGLVSGTIKYANGGYILGPDPTYNGGVGHAFNVIAGETYTVKGWLVTNSPYGSYPSWYDQLSMFVRDSQSGQWILLKVPGQDTLVSALGHSNHAGETWIPTAEFTALATSSYEIWFNMPFTSVQRGGLETSLTKASVTGPMGQRITPLALDLNGDGLHTLGTDDGVVFDVDGNHTLEQTGWIAPDDGLLVLDLNGDGLINDGAELFGSGTAMLNEGGVAQDGFEALVQYDGNGDGVIDAHDQIFDALQVWVDCNTDGVTDAGELLFLRDLGIASIQLNAVASSEEDQGNVLSLQSTFTTTDGVSQVLADVSFATLPFMQDAELGQALL